jgi:MFS family permease
MLHFFNSFARMRLPEFSCRKTRKSPIMKVERDIEQRVAQQSGRIEGASPMNSVKPRSFFLSSLPFFILAHATHHLLTALPQPMQPFMQDEFGLSKAQLGGVTAAFSLSSGASQLPAGWLADRIGPTWLITIGVLGVGIGGVLVGLSHSYAMLLVFLVLMGLMAGGYHPASTPLISLSVPANQRGRALGLHLIGGNSSFFLAPLIAGAIAAAWGWRHMR